MVVLLLNMTSWVDLPFPLRNEATSLKKSLSASLTPARASIATELGTVSRFTEAWETTAAVKKR